MFISCLQLRILKTKNMSKQKERWLQRLQHMNTELNALLSRIEAYNEQELHFKPAADAWSIAQVLHHLFIGEAGTMHYIRKKLSYGPPPALTRWHRLRGRLLKLMLSLPLKFKAPAVVSQVPERPDVPAIIEQWRATRKEMEDFIRNMPAEYEHKALFKHPVAGRMGIEGILDFWEEHLRHHIRQIDRIEQRMQASFVK
ncbi:MAG: PadR family transcriptional regulator [Thermonema sp.]|nr:MAG: PadR family transcriptional regulator [Thermonema sp.]